MTLAPAQVIRRLAASRREAMTGVGPPSETSKRTRRRSQPASSESSDSGTGEQEKYRTETGKCCGAGGSSAMYYGVGECAWTCYPTGRCADGRNAGARSAPVKPNQREGRRIGILRSHTSFLGWASADRPIPVVALPLFPDERD